MISNSASPAGGKTWPILLQTEQHQQNADAAQQSVAESIEKEEEQAASEAADQSQEPR
jgi:hypothetical protein